MSLLRVLGRPMLASMFVAGGLDSVRHPENVSPLAEPVVRPITDRVPVLPDRTEDCVRLSGAVQVVGGLLLATGRMSRRPRSRSPSRWCRPRWPRIGSGSWRIPVSGLSSASTF